MLSLTQRQFENVPLYSNEQPPPKEYVLDEVLKVVENQLVKRGLVPNPRDIGAYPLWFIAETERNVFLWRHGFSLDDRSQFEFWISPVKLIEKRLKHLSKTCPENPFLHQGSPELRTLEEQYLEQLLLVEEQIGLHAHALSLVASELQQQCAGAPNQRKVLLPSTSEIALNSSAEDSD